MKALMILFTVLMLALTACQPGATADPAALSAQVEGTPTVKAAKPTATMLPLTETAEPTATAVPPTATAEPTATEVVPTPTDEPLPEMSVETLTGTWTQFDSQDQGNNWLIFEADGTYEAKHGPSPETGILVLEGTYSVEAGVVTLTDVDDCPTGETYEARFVTQTRIAFDLKELCGSEQLLPDQRGWTRSEE